MSASTDQWVEEFYEQLFKFAHSLCGNPVDAADFTQETFYRVHMKRHQLHTPSRVKSWLFTTLYRHFLKQRQRHARYQQYSLEEADRELPHVNARRGEGLDARFAWGALQRMDDRFRQPLILFYLENKSYQEIARATCLPMGTVMSRISRGKQALALLLDPQADSTTTVGMNMNVTPANCV